MKVQVWSSGAGEPAGLNRASGMSVRTSLLAGLLRVTPRCNVHTARVSTEVKDCNTGGEGCWKKCLHVYDAVHAKSFGIYHQ